MLHLVCRQLLHRPLRTAFTLIAVAATIGAVLVIQGFQTGIYWQLPGLVLNRGGDLIVTQAGITNMIAARSTLPQLARRGVEAIDGVKIAHPLTAISAIYDGHGRKTPIFILSMTALAGPRTSSPEPRPRARATSSSTARSRAFTASVSASASKSPNTRSGYPESPATMSPSSPPSPSSPMTA